MTFARVHVVVNDGSGAAQTHADLLSAGALAARGWTRHGCRPGDNPAELARQAIAAGADLVVAAGGDGTVTGVADALLGTGVALGIVPLGTANVFAAEMGIPDDPAAALDLLARGPHRVRTVDTGVLDGPAGGAVLLRLGVGIEAAMTVFADADEKAASGRWAYFRTALRVRRLPPVRYRLTLDGVAYVPRGVTCLVCNSGNLGVPGLSMLPTMRLDDGLLDVIVLRRATLPALLGVTARIALAQFTRRSEPANSPAVFHRTAREVTLTPDPPQVVARDGEPVERPGPYRVRVAPGALRVVAPAEA